MQFLFVLAQLGTAVVREYWISMKQMHLC